MGYAVSVTIITPEYYLTLLTQPKDFRLQVGQSCFSKRIFSFWPFQSVCYRINAQGERNAYPKKELYRFF